MALMAALMEKGEGFFSNSIYTYSETFALIKNRFNKIEFVYHFALFFHFPEIAAKKENQIQASKDYTGIGDSMGEVGKMVAVGLVWGATNALMRKGALICDENIKSAAQTNTPAANPVFETLKNWFNLLLTWQYSLPFILNLSASATFFATLNDTPISLAVPVTNATTFAATAVFGMLLGEENRVGLTLFGTLLIILGVYFCSGST